MLLCVCVHATGQRSTWPLPIQFRIDNVQIQFKQFFACFVWFNYTLQYVEFMVYSWHIMLGIVVAFAHTRWYECVCVCVSIVNIERDSMRRRGERKGASNRSNQRSSSRKTRFTMCVCIWWYGLISITVSSIGQLLSKLRRHQPTRGINVDNWWNWKMAKCIMAPTKKLLLPLSYIHSIHHIHTQYQNRQIRFSVVVIRHSTRSIFW